MTRSPETAQYLAAVKTAFREVERIPSSHRATPGVCGHWSLKDLMAHLAYWDGYCANYMHAKATASPWPGITQPFDVINAREAGKRADWSWDDVMAEIRANRERVLPLMIDPGEDEGFLNHQHWEEHCAQIADFADAIPAPDPDTHA